MPRQVRSAGPRRVVGGLDGRTPSLVPLLAMGVTVYQYPKCSTCRKALKWLDARGVRYTAIDLVAKPIAAAKLKQLHARSGLPIKRFFNTSGESYKHGDFKTKLPDMTDAQAIDALAKDGKLVKRPIVDAGTQVLVGFDDAEYDQALG
jgi:arsenate reductase